MGKWTDKWAKEKTARETKRKKIKKAKVERRAARKVIQKDKNLTFSQKQDLRKASQVQTRASKSLARAGFQEEMGDIYTKQKWRGKAAERKYERGAKRERKAEDIMKEQGLDLGHLAKLRTGTTLMKGGGKPPPGAAGYVAPPPDDADNGDQKPPGIGEQISNLFQKTEGQMPLSFKDGKATRRQTQLEEKINQAALEAGRGATERAQMGGRSRGGALERQLRQTKLEKGKALGEAQTLGEEADWGKRLGQQQLKLGVLQQAMAGQQKPVSWGAAGFKGIDALLGTGFADAYETSAGEQSQYPGLDIRSAGKGGAPVVGAPKPIVPGQIPKATPTPIPAQRTGNVLGSAQQGQTPRFGGGQMIQRVQQRQALRQAGGRSIMDRLRKKMTRFAGSPATKIQSGLRGY